MSDVTMSGAMADVHSPRPPLDEKPHVGGAIGFLVVIAAAIAR
jgi:hypothetical protein